MSSELTNTRRRSSLHKAETEAGVVRRRSYELVVAESESSDRLGLDNYVEHASRSKTDYFGVWIRHPYYRLYFFSHLCQNMGDWFVRIASLLLVTELAPEEGTGLAHLVLANILPKAIFAQVGGVLADNFDRRHIMISLDVLSGIVTLGFLLAIQYKSLPLLYLITTLRAACGAMYYPATTAMVRMLVPEEHDLLLANTMNSWAWSSMAAVGGLLAGSLSAVIGLKSCYIVDSVTFWISALLVTQIRGQYNVVNNDVHIQQASNETADAENPKPPIRIPTEIGRDESCYCCTAAKDFGLYLLTCGFGILTLLKATASLIWGAEDIISTAFAEDGSVSESDKSVRMGLTFTFIGTGCFIGPTVANLYTDTDQPRTLLFVCITGMCLQLASWVGMWQAHHFWAFLLFTLVRAIGSSTIWVNSTLLLQTFSDKQQLGKVLAVEYLAYTVTESLAATTAGRMEDAGVSKNQIALYSAGVAVVAIAFWSYQASGRQLSLSSEWGPEELGQTELADMEKESDISSGDETTETVVTLTSTEDII